MFFVALLSMVCLLTAAPLQASRKRCCLPIQYSATLLQVGARLNANSMDPALTDATLVVNSDWNMKMQRIEMNKLNQESGKMEHLQIWHDFNNSKSYTLVKNVCFVEKLYYGMALCIPDTATLVGSYKLGGGANMIQIDSYLVQQPAMVVRFEVEPTSCMPVAVLRHGEFPDGSRELNSLIFTDVKPTLTMANPFQLPDACKHPFIVPVEK